MSTSIHLRSGSRRVVWGVAGGKTQMPLLAAPDWGGGPQRPHWHCQCSVENVGGVELFRKFRLIGFESWSSGILPGTFRANGCARAEVRYDLPNKPQDCFLLINEQTYLRSLQNCEELTDALVREKVRGLESLEWRFWVVRLLWCCEFLFKLFVLLASCTSGPDRIGNTDDNAGAAEKKSSPFSVLYVQRRRSSRQGTRTCSQELSPELCLEQQDSHSNSNRRAQSSTLWPCLRACWSCSTPTLALSLSLALYGSRLSISISVSSLFLSPSLSLSLSLYLSFSLLLSLSFSLSFSLFLSLFSLFFSLFSSLFRSLFC